MIWSHYHDRRTEDTIAGQVLQTKHVAPWRLFYAIAPELGRSRHHHKPRQRLRCVERSPGEERPSDRRRLIPCIVLYRTLRRRAGTTMAKLVLKSPEDVTEERLHAALSERLSSKYDVLRLIFESDEGWPRIRKAKVRKDALMAILVKARSTSDGTDFVTSYDPGSSLISVPLMALLIPIFLFLRLRRSPARYELETEVIAALKDKWPDVTEQN